MNHITNRMRTVSLDAAMVAMLAGAGLVIFAAVVLWRAAPERDVDSPTVRLCRLKAANERGIDAGRMSADRLPPLWHYEAVEGCPRPRVVWDVEEANRGQLYGFAGAVLGLLGMILWQVTGRRHD